MFLLIINSKDWCRELGDINLVRIANENQNTRLTEILQEPKCKGKSKWLTCVISSPTDDITFFLYLLHFWLSIAFVMYHKLKKNIILYTTLKSCIYFISQHLWDLIVVMVNLLCLSSGTSYLLPTKARDIHWTYLHFRDVLGWFLSSVVRLLSMGFRTELNLPELWKELQTGQLCDDKYRWRVGYWRVR